MSNDNYDALVGRMWVSLVELTGIAATHRSREDRTKAAVDVLDRLGADIAKLNDEKITEIAKECKERAEG